MALPGALVITLLDDGSIKVDARKLEGTTPEIMRELQALASELGGELVVERHVGGVHSHVHGGQKITHSH